MDAHSMEMVSIPFVTPVFGARQVIRPGNMNFFPLGYWQIFYQTIEWVRFVHRTADIPVFSEDWNDPLILQAPDFVLGTNRIAVNVARSRYDGCSMWKSDDSPTCRVERIKRLLHCLLQRSSGIQRLSVTCDCNVEFISVA